MKIEAVTVCVDYADFLAETLPLNIRQFDQMVVVTTPADTATQAVCELHNVQCVLFDGFGPPGQFRKAAGINKGLEHLALDGWVCHLDADMALPAQARTVIEHVGLNPDSVYGMDRHIIEGYDAWVAHKQGGLVQQQLETCLVHGDHYPLGARLNIPRHDGWAPIGFFQLWCPAASGITRYPDSGNGGADRDDMLFSLQWPRANRGFIPELIAWHLESAPAPMGANWRGRHTPTFAPTPTRHPERHLYWSGPLAAIPATVFGGLPAAAILLALVLILGLILIWRDRTPTISHPARPYFPETP